MSDVLSDAVGQTTPMIRQYRELKAQAPDCLLFFRLGDFYEMFFEDAKVASEICGLTLTARHKQSAQVVPMCGVPYHAAASYVAKLGAAGKKVAICEQMQDPAEAKGLVERKIVRIITPGMPFDPLTVQAEETSRVSVCTRVEEQWAVAVIDTTSGEFWYALPSDLGTLQTLLLTLSVKECLISSQWATELSQWAQDLEKQGCAVEWCDSSFFAVAEARTRLKAQFGVTHLEAYILPAHGDAAVMVCGAALKYVQLCEPQSTLSHVYTCSYLSLGQCMLLAPSVVHSLELIRAPYAQDRDLGLAGVMDGSRTPLGRRLLRRRLLAPLLDITEIKRRHQLQQDFLNAGPSLIETCAKLSEVGDVERLYSKICLGYANPREVWRLGCGLATAWEVLKTAEQFETLRDYVHIPPELPLITDQILETLVDEPPILRREGGVIRPEKDPQLKAAVEAESRFTQWRDTYEKKLQKSLNIPSLKIKHSRVFGYGIEVTKTHLGKVPPAFVRKQTMAGAERFLSPELRTRESEYVLAKNRQVQIEEQIFSDLLSFLTSKRQILAQFFGLLAEVDMGVGQCKIIGRQGWCRPVVDDSKQLTIKEGFHPVVKELLKREGRSYVTHTLVMNSDQDTSLFLISGPNMGGKSTLMRQVAISVILAQAGFFVPAAAAHLGLVDHVFTRMGASDVLTEGKSTFYMEMQETAHFLMQGTDRSLILIDELGRGTSTYDGLSIVWSVCEFLLTQLKCRCFCATHFYELAKLKDYFPKVGLFHVGADVMEGELIFNYRLKPGFTSQSYGVHVARLAGVRPEVVKRAQEILRLFESNRGMGKKEQAHTYEGRSEKVPSREQIDLF